MFRAANISTEMPSFRPSGDLFAAASPIELAIGPIDGVSHVVIIPQGYHFDGASIPSMLWPLIGSPFEPDLMLAACIHDWYCEHTMLDYQSRVIGDAVFFYLLQRAGIPRWRRVLLYLGVRLHSWWCYGSQQK